MLLRALKEAAALPFHDTVYSIRYGVARGLKRRGGLGFLARQRPLMADEKFLLQVPLSGRVVYDVGCLEGLYTLFFARAVGPRGQVVAFEPNPQNCMAIRGNVALNGFMNVQLLDIGLGTGPGAMDLVIPFGFPGQGTVDGELQTHYLRQAGTKRVSVRIDSLDRVLAANELPPPDLIKIDVEGFELQVVDGAVGTLRAHKPKLFVELHGLEAEHRLANMHRLVGLLREVGYTSALHVESGQPVDLTSTRPYEGHLWVS
jgi:FkbM family methyltransferase